MNKSILTEYLLPDKVILEDHESYYRYLVWKPDMFYLVLGNSNNIEKAVFYNKAVQDNIPIIKRSTGGQSVLLSPNMIAISALINTEKQLASKKYFTIYSNRIIRSLEELGVNNLQIQGISDITLNNRKILGSSMYRNKHSVFFHAILNVSESPHRIGTYLKHPDITPDYRDGRDHKTFVTSLYEQGFDFTIDTIRYTIEKNMSKAPHGDAFSSE